MTTTNRIPGAHIAARYSTDNQNADSIEVQVNRCTEYCNAHGLRILNVYADYAVSGMKNTRPEFERMMNDLRNGYGDTVVIYDQSRMFRDMVAWFTFRDDMTKLGVTVISVTQPMVGGDLKDPANFITESTMAIFNQLWVLQTRQKVVSKMRWMAQQGIHTGGKPALGYRKNAEGRLEIDEAEAAIVRRIFREYADGKSYREIILGLNNDGLKTKKGTAFGRNSLHDMLKNERYIGTLIYGEKVYRADGTRNTSKPEGVNPIRIEDAIPAIIEKDTFRAVQERLALNRQDKNGRPASARSYPLHGKVFCGDCGAAMSVAASKRKGHTYYYYRCTRKDRTGECTAAPIRVDKLEEIVVQNVRALMGTPKNQQEALDLIKAESAKLTGSAASRYTAILNDLGNISAQTKNIVDAIASGAYHPSLNARLTELETQKDKLEAQAAQLKRQVEVASLPAERLEEIYHQIISAAPNDTAAVCAVVSRVEVYADSIIIYTAFDPTPGPKQLKDTTPELDSEFIRSVGTTSGVPRVFITVLGVVIAAKRAKKELP